MKKLLALLLLLAPWWMAAAQAQPVTPFPTFLTGQNPTSIPLGSGDLVPVIQGGVTTKLARPFTSINGTTCYLTDSCTIGALLSQISLVNGHIIVGNASNLAADVAMSGVVAITNAGVTSLNANSVGNAALVNASTTVNGQTCTLGSTCTITASATGITVATTTVSGGSTGNLLYDNAGVLGEKTPTGTGNVVLATSPTVSGLTVTGSLTATGLVTNGDLVNTATTVNGQTCTLGSTCTITASATSIAVGTTTITGGTTTQFLYDNAGTLGNKTIACADLSNGATGCSTATGTSGATIPLLNGTNTWSGVQSFNNGDVSLSGSSSGATVLHAPATGGVSMTFPAGTDTVAALGTVETFTAAQTFAEVHGGLPEVVVLTSNDYVAVAADCGKIKTLPTGTTPTVHLPNLNVGCTIVFVTSVAKSYQFLAASGGSTINSQGFSHSRGTNAGDTVSATIVVNSGSAATWNISGDLTS